MATATVTSKGQVTIPKRIREKLKVRAGDRLDFVEETEGRIILRKASLAVEDLEGLLYRPDRAAVSVEDMHQAVRRRQGADS